MNVLRVIKINILALIAFPLLIVATAVKLLAKAMEKTLTIIGTVFVIGGIALLFELAKDPSGLLQGLVLLIVLFVVGGLLIAICIWILSLISGIIMACVSVIINLVNWLYELLYAGYAGLYHICYEDYCFLEMGKAAKIGSCFIYTLLRICNRLIIFFATHALKLLLVASALLIGYAIYSTNNYIQSMFGIHVFAYLKLFAVYEIIYGVVLYLAVLAGIVVILISLGIEWSEWGEEMSMSTTEYEGYIKNMKEEYTALNHENIGKLEDVNKKQRERYTYYAQLLNLHMDTFEAFLNDIAPIVEKSEDYILRANRGQYITDLNDINEVLKKHNGMVPSEEFDKLIPLIEQVDKTRKKIEEQVQQIREAKAGRADAAQGGFFAGCDTMQKLEKRYKALCKTYHPDSEAGDEDTFKRMKDEYNSKKAELAEKESQN